MKPPRHLIRTLADIPPPAERYMRDAETLLDYANTIDGAA